MTILSLQLRAGVLVRCLYRRGRCLTSQLVVESASGLRFCAMSYRVIVMYDPSLGFEAGSSVNKRVG
jgi:hypothetical protein